MGVGAVLRGALLKAVPGWRAPVVKDSLSPVGIRHRGGERF